MSLFTADGDLKTWVYAVCIIAMVLLILAAALIYHKTHKSAKLTTKQLVCCAALMALAFITSFIPIGPDLPYGGKVSLFSMLFICLAGYWYGPSVGLITGLAYGILQFLQDPIVVSFFQICCDYILAFAALGTAGFFWKSKNGLLKGYLLGIFLRGAFHTLGGYLYWRDYMPENFPQELAAFYPIIYNYSYILLEGLLTVIVILLPPVAKALNQVKKIAVE